MTTTPTEKEAFDQEVKHILQQLASMEPESKEYKEAVTNLKTLTEARSQKTKYEVSIDTIVSGTISLLGILLVLNHERLNVITTKSMGFIPKVRS